MPNTNCPHCENGVIDYLTQREIEKIGKDVNETFLGCDECDFFCKEDEKDLCNL